jgi:hypothetical protein
LERAEQLPKHTIRGVVRPLPVVEQQHERAPRGQPEQELAQSDGQAALQRGELERARADCSAQACEVQERRQVLDQRGGDLDQALFCVARRFDATERRVQIEHLRHDL